MDGERFSKLIDSSITAVEYKIKMLKNNYNLEDTTDKIRFLNKMAEILAKVPNNIERDIYIEKLSKDLGVGKEALIAEVEKHLFKDENSKEKTYSLQANNENKSNSAEISEIEETILYLLTSKSKDVYDEVKKYVFVDDLKSEVSKSLCSKIYESYENKTIFNIDLTSLCSSTDELNLITKIMAKPNTSVDFPKITEEVLSNFKSIKIERRKSELLDLMKSTTDTTELNKYQSELREIIQSTGRK